MVSRSSAASLNESRSRSSMAEEERRNWLAMVSERDLPRLSRQQKAMSPHNISWAFRLSPVSRRNISSR